MTLLLLFYYMIIVSDKEKLGGRHLNPFRLGQFIGNSCPVLLHSVLFIFVYLLFIIHIIYNFLIWD